MALGGQISTKGDVYNYEVLLLDMFIILESKCSTNEKFKDGTSLHKHAALQNLPMG